MNVLINGETHNLTQNCTIDEALKLFNLPLGSFVIEINGDILHKEMFSNHILQENDSLEIIRFVGGG